MYRMDKIREQISYWVGCLTTAVGALSLNEWALITGIICTIGTFAINWYYKEKEYRKDGNVSGSTK